MINYNGYIVVFTRLRTNKNNGALSRKDLKGLILEISRFINNLTVNYIGEHNNIYNFVLDNLNSKFASNKRILLVNSLPCVTFGHNILDNIITFHPFYATNLVVNFLSSFPDFLSPVPHIYPERNPCSKCLARKGNG